MNHRKIVVFVATLLCCLLFASCNNSPTETPKNTQTPTGNPTQDPTPESRTIIDIVPYITEYLTWRGGIGNIQIATTEDNVIISQFGNNNIVLFQIADLYFMPGLDSNLKVIRENKIIAYINFYCVDTANTPGDLITISPNIYNISDSIINDSYYFIDNTVTAPKIGYYITKDTQITDSMISNFNNYTYWSTYKQQYLSGNPHNYQMVALYVLDLNDGYPHHDLISMGFNQIQSNRVFLAIYKELDKEEYISYILIDVVFNENTETIVANYDAIILVNEYGSGWFNSVDEIISFSEDDLKYAYTYTRIY